MLTDKQTSVLKVIISYLSVFDYLFQMQRINNLRKRNHVQVKHTIFKSEVYVYVVVGGKMVEE